MQMGGLGRTVAIVPTEKVLLLALSFPALSEDKLRDAARFVAEPYVAQPIEDVHVALGPATDDGKHRLLVVIDGKYLAELRTKYPGCTILPDALLLPTPAPGSWAATKRGDVVVFRLPDGTGLAGRGHVARALWERAGSPQITQYGSEDIGAAGLQATNRIETPPPPVGVGFDIRDRGGRRRDALRAGSWIAASVALVAMLHLSLAAFETARLRQQADDIESTLRSELIDRGFAADGPIDASVAAALSASNHGTGKTFLPLLNTSLDALKAQAGLIQLEKITYAADEHVLELALVGTFLPDLQDAAAAISTLNLRVEAGTATSTDNEARMTLTVRSEE